MPEAPLKPQDTGDINALYCPTHDEAARQRLVSSLRKHALIDMKGEMARSYADEAVPAFKKKNKRAPKTGREAAQLMEPTPIYRFYSSLRYNAQEMVWHSVLDPVERALPEMISVARAAAKSPSSGGSLKLNPSLEMPRHITALDVHLVPGCFHSEHAQDDVAQGAVGAFGSNVFTAAFGNRRNNPGAVAQSVGHWLRQAYPDFKPRRVLDLGTSSGKNLLPYLEIFPGIEAHGIDVGAPLLRWGHAQAEQAGLPVHFSQQNAEHTNFPDGYFDLIVSSFFFHEMPVSSTRRVLKECRRLLAKGGMMAHMELPPTKDCDAFTNFYWDWDTLNNNEPSYTAYRAQAPAALCAEAGFAKGGCYENHIPNAATTSAENYGKWMRGEVPPPPHGNGGWFIFGAKG